MNKVEGPSYIWRSPGRYQSADRIFTDKLGMELVALYWMHGVDNTFHRFLRLNDEGFDRSCP